MPERIRTGRRDEGFTLIELLIVIVILGILAAIVVFAVSSTRKDSVTSSCKTDVKSIQLAAEAYKTKNGNYPPHSATVGATEQDKLLDANGGLLNNWPDSDQYTLAFSTVGATPATYSIGVSGTANKITGTPAVTNTSTSANVATFCAGT